MKIKPIKLKTLLLYVVVTLLFGVVGALLGGNTSEVYSTLIKPPLSPPGIVFPIVWSILYALMGTGAYILSTEKAESVNFLLKIYWIQLILNVLWPLVFWQLNWYAVAAIIIAVLLALNLLFVILASKVNKVVSILFIPYLIWLAFALYLNIGIAVLN